MYKVSIIIPVYNAEKYLTQCMESLLSQTLQECEFIFVNDGSRDNSRQIIEEFVKTDKRIKLINQKNQGVSVARNMGVNVASGEYIGFVDADDYIERDMYEVLYASAKQNDCDVVITNFEGELEGCKFITKCNLPVDIVLDKDYIHNEILPQFIKCDDFNSVCNKIYKNKVIKDYNVGFPQKVAVGEDAIFNVQFFGKATMLKYIDYTGYHYREVVGSATRNLSKNDYFNRALEVYNSMENHIGITDKEAIQRLKSIRLLKKVMSCIHIYFKPCENVSFAKRYKYVRNMICNEYVRQALAESYDEIDDSLGRYDRFLIEMIKRRFTFGLYCATAYSRFRNK